MIEGPKTNNHAEEWHRKINRAAGKAHPNIFELVELFKTEQANTEVNTGVCLAQLAAGGAVRNTRKKYSTIAEEFEKGDYTLEEYMDGINKWMGFSICVVCILPSFIFFILTALC